MDEKMNLVPEESQVNTSSCSCNSYDEEKKDLLSHPDSDVCVFEESTDVDSDNQVYGDDAEDEEIETDDSLTFSDDAIEKIVARGICQVPGVLGMKSSWVNRFTETFGAKDPGKGVEIEVCEDGSLRIYASILISEEVFAPEVFEQARGLVICMIKSITSLEVSGFHLRIEDILTKEEFEASRKAYRDTRDDNYDED